MTSLWTSCRFKAVNEADTGGRFLLFSRKDRGLSFVGDLNDKAISDTTLAWPEKAHEPIVEIDKTIFYRCDLNRFRKDSLEEYYAGELGKVKAVLCEDPLLRIVSFNVGRATRDCEVHAMIAGLKPHLVILTEVPTSALGLQLDAYEGAQVSLRGTESIHIYVKKEKVTLGETAESSSNKEVAFRTATLGKDGPEFQLIASHMRLHGPFPRLIESKLPWILVGDLNADPCFLFQFYNLKEVALPAFVSTTPKGSSIDNVCLSQGCPFKVAKAEVLKFITVSDHFPIVVDLVRDNTEYT